MTEHYHAWTRFLYGIRCRLFHRWAPWCEASGVCWACCETYRELSCENIRKAYPLATHSHQWSFDSHIPVLDFGPRSVRHYSCQCGAEGTSDGFTGVISERVRK